jgi:predicted PurR-regulated permease PerM
MSVLAKVTDVFSTSLGLLTDVVIGFFIGLFLAAQPQVYLTGLLRLLPREKRARAREVLHAIAYTLKWWLIGQFTSMSIVGFLFALGLWLLHVPLALTLGLLAMLLAFIPYIGPLLAAVPAVLFALTQSPTRALYVLVLYTAIQLIESYVLTPLIQRQAVLLPPVLTILAQVLLGVFVGGFGLMLATPLVATVLVLVKMLYIEDILGEPVQVTGS